MGRHGFQGFDAWQKLPKLNASESIRASQDSHLTHNNEFWCSGCKCLRPLPHTEELAFEGITLVRDTWQVRKGQGRFAWLWDGGWRPSCSGLGEVKGHDLSKRLQQRVGPPARIDWALSMRAENKIMLNKPNRHAST